MLVLDKDAILAYKMHLISAEYAPATVSKYTAGLQQLARFCGGNLSEKAQLLDFKAMMEKSGRGPITINGMVSAVNKFLEINGYDEWKLKYLQVQHRPFLDSKRELHIFEYEKMVNTAMESGNERMALIVQTICTTGVRVSELQAVTVKALHTGKAEIHNKGKIRVILLPMRLCQMLLDYTQRHGIKEGPVFVTSSGKPLDRSNIWRSMNNLAKKAGVSLSKAFPHNLRHLFARTYYKKYHDVVRLADILGHASVETTRIYTAHSAAEQRRQIDALDLLL